MLFHCLFRKINEDRFEIYPATLQSTDVFYLFIYVFFETLFCTISNQATSPAPS